MYVAGFFRSVCTCSTNSNLCSCSDSERQMCSCDLLSFLVLGLSECLQNRRVCVCVFCQKRLFQWHGMVWHDIEIAHVHIKIDAKTTKIHTLASVHAIWPLEWKRHWRSVENERKHRHKVCNKNKFYSHKFEIRKSTVEQAQMVQATQKMWMCDGKEMINVRFAEPSLCKPFYRWGKIHTFELPVYLFMAVHAAVTGSKMWAIQTMELKSLSPSGFWQSNLIENKNVG